jgi:hypothetical protein
LMDFAFCSTILHQRGIALVPMGALSGILP